MNEFPRLPPASNALREPETRPYFLWWTDVTVGELQKRLASKDPKEKAYWMGVLSREAKTREVWLFVTVDGIRRLWPQLIPYLGRARAMWSYLLDLPAEWPPPEARRAQEIRW